MKEYLKCRACGYIMNKKNAPDICPGCGVGNKAFEDYRYNVSEFRRIVMSIDIHPISVHLPQSISVLIPFLLILGYFTDTAIIKRLVDSAEILAFIYPLSVLAASATGVFDGRARFKKFNTPAHKQKVIWGALLLLISCTMFYLVTTKGMNNVLVPVIILSFSAIAVEIRLARIGIKLMYAHMPG